MSELEANQRVGILVRREIKKFFFFVSSVVLDFSYTPPCLQISRRLYIPAVPLPNVPPPNDHTPAISYTYISYSIDSSSANTLKTHC